MGGGGRKEGEGYHCKFLKRQPTRIIYSADLQKDEDICSTKTSSQVFTELFVVTKW